MNEYDSITPTKKQKILLDFVDSFVKSNGYSPTLREIMRPLGYKSVSTVAKHVDNLIARGWLVKRDGEARSLEVVHPGEARQDAGHRQWLAEQVRKKLEDTGISDEDRAALARVRELFALDEGYEGTD